MIKAPLTAAGVKVDDPAFTKERSAEALENGVLNSESSLEGRVKIAAHDGPADLILSARLASILDQNPVIDVGLDTEQRVERLMAGEVDLTLTFSTPTHANLVALALGVSRRTIDEYVGAACARLVVMRRLISQ